MYNNEEVWEKLEEAATEHLNETKSKSAKGFLYLGIGLYRQQAYDQALLSFEKAVDLDDSDPQIYYNIGLANFKTREYELALQFWEKTVSMDPLHSYAWNNLAFLHNMNLVPVKKGENNWKNAVRVCSRATKAFEEEMTRNGDAACSGMSTENINCHRQWAFAEFKLGTLTTACK